LNATVFDIGRSALGVGS